MIDVSTGITNALDDVTITAVSFITLDFPAIAGGSMLITEAPRDITIDGRSFSSESNLVSLSAPAVQSSISRDKYTISFADNNYLMRDKFSLAPAGVPLTVEMGFVNSATGELLPDLLNVYKGQSGTIEWSKEDEGYILKASFTGQLTQLKTIRSRKTSETSQRDIDNDDRSMRYIHDSAGDTTLKWGRAVGNTSAGRGNRG
jgi:hypothetical protein